MALINNNMMKNLNDLSLRFNGHFPGGPGLAGVYDGGGGDKWTTEAISHAKLQSNHHHWQTNIQFFYRPDALPVAQPTVSSTEGKNITIHGLADPKLIWGSSNFVFDH